MGFNFKILTVPEVAEKAVTLVQTHRKFLERFSKIASRFFKNNAHFFKKTLRYLQGNPVLS